MQANDALNDVQQAIQVYAHIMMFKKNNIRGQHANTQACGALDHAAKKKNRAKVKYMIAHQCLQALSPGLNKDGWEQVLCPLMMMLT